MSLWRMSRWASTLMAAKPGCTLLRPLASGKEMSLPPPSEMTILPCCNSAETTVSSRSWIVSSSPVVTTSPRSVRTTASVMGGLSLYRACRMAAGAAWAPGRPWLRVTPRSCGQPTMTWVALDRSFGESDTTSRSSTSYGSWDDAGSSGGVSRVVRSLSVIGFVLS